MVDVVIVSLVAPQPPAQAACACEAGDGASCGAGVDGGRDTGLDGGRDTGAGANAGPDDTGTTAACHDTGADAGGDTSPVRAAVRHCADVLAAAGATVRTVAAGSDAEIDAVLTGLDGPDRPDGLPWPAPDGPRLIIAATGDAEARAVLRRMVRRYAPPPSRRPDDLRADRTVPDLPAVGILPLNPVPPDDLLTRLGLPTDPAGVAAAVLHGRSRRLDLLRTDSGSVTLHGAVIGGASAEGAPVPWRGTVDVDDTSLCRPDEAVLACAVANADGQPAALEGLPLTPGADPADGSVDVAVVVAVARRRRLGRRTGALEVRRTRGRAVAVRPAAAVPYVDDGVSATLDRPRTWWIERGAWAVFTG